MYFKKYILRNKENKYVIKHVSHFDIKMIFHYIEGDFEVHVKVIQFIILFIANKKFIQINKYLKLLKNNENKYVIKHVPHFEIKWTFYYIEVDFD